MGGALKGSELLGRLSADGSIRPMFGRCRVQRLSVSAGWTARFASHDAGAQSSSSPPCPVNSRLAGL